MNRVFRIQGIILSAALAAAALTGCADSMEPVKTVASAEDTAVSKDETSASEAVKVETMKPEQKTVSVSSTFVGTVAADSTVYVVPMVSGLVTEKYFEVGDHVNEGDLLFTIDDASAQLSLSQANAALSSARAGLQATQASYTAQQAANAAAHDSATESMGKLETASQQMQTATDAAYAQATQAGLQAQTASAAYSTLLDNISDAKEKRDDLIDSRDSAQAAADAAKKAAEDLGKQLAEAQAAETPDIAAIAELSEQLKAAQSSVVSAQTYYQQMASAVESADSSIKQLESNLTSAANAVESAGLSYQIAKENAEDTQRQQQDFELYTKPASTTAIGSQLVGSDAQLAAGGAQVSVSRASVTQASVGVESAQMALDYYSITSPVSGVITAINVSEHNMASPSQPAYTIESENDRKITFYVAEKTAMGMRLGNDAILHRDGVEIPAKITLITDTIDSATGLFRVEARPTDAASASLVNGSQISIDTVTRQAQNALAVPITAVYYDGEQAFVYINNKGRAHRMDVTTGLSDDEMIEISSGLTPDDEVVTSWSSQLKEGTSITTLDTAAKALPAGDVKKEGEVIGFEPIPADDPIRKAGMAGEDH